MQSGGVRLIQLTFAKGIDATLEASPIPSSLLERQISPSGRRICNKDPAKSHGFKVNCDIGKIEPAPSAQGVWSPFIPQRQFYTELFYIKHPLSNNETPK